MMEIKSNELEEYVGNVLSAAKRAIESQDFHIDGPIEFDLAVTNVSDTAGGLKIYVASAEGKQKSEEITRIHFKASKNSHFSSGPSQITFRPTEFN